jgi:c-di-GMP-binding flagellar brake protein YcgR/competence protein ComGC
MNLFLLQDQVQYFKEDDPVAGTLVLVGIGGILLIVFISNLVKNGIGAGKVAGGGAASRKISFLSMHRIAKAYGLDSEQAKILEYVLRSGGVTDPERTVSNPAVLDKHFKRAFRQIEKSANSEEEAQQKLAMLFSVRNIIEVRHNTSPDDPSSQRISSNMAAVLTVNHESYPVKIITSKGESVLVECPRNAIGTLIRFPKGTRVNLAFFTKTSKGFSFDCQVLGISDTSFGPGLQLSHGGRAKSMTQRRFRRRQASLSCDYYLVRLEEQKNKKQAPKMVVDTRRMSGSLTDVSIGGCAVKTQSSVPAGSRLKIEFDYPHSALPIAVLGQVLRINRSGIANTIMHVKFLKVPRKAMNAINSLVFDYGND